MKKLLLILFMLIGYAYGQDQTIGRKNNKVIVLGKLRIDTVLYDVNPGDTLLFVDATGTIKKTRVVIIGGSSGIDSLIISDTSICKWFMASPRCFMTGGYFHDVGLNSDSTAYIFFNDQGDSVRTAYVPHSEVFAKYPVWISDTLAGNKKLISLRRSFIDSVFANRGKIDTIYTTPDSNYLVIVYTNGTRDSIQWIGSSGGGGGATRFDELLDVTITSPLNNQIPVYNSSTSKWENITPVQFSLAGKRPNDILMFDSTNNQFYNTRPLFTASTTTKKMLVIDTLTKEFNYTEIPTLANNAWALAGNTVVTGDFIGSTNNRSVNIRTNNTRIANFDSVGGFNIYPLTSTSIGMTMFRAGSTVNFPFRLAGDASSNAVISSTNNAIVVKTNFNSGGGNLENARFTENVTGTTRTSLPQFIVTGRTDMQIGTPSGSEVSYGATISSVSGPTRRFSLGINNLSDAVFGLNNVGWNLYQDNDAASGARFGAGSYMRVYATLGNVVIQNKGTYPVMTGIDTSSRFTVVGDTGWLAQGAIPAPVMNSSSRIGMTTAVMGVTITNAGSGYTNGNYPSVSLPGGSGVGAQANITVAGGVITVADATNGSFNHGRGYAIGDVVTPTIPGGSGLILTVSSIANVATGLQVYDSSLNTNSAWNGLGWTNGVASSSAGTLTLQHGGDYVATGTTTTWTLPAVATNIQGRQNMITIKNAGSGNITLNSSSGGNDIYNTAAVNTLTIAAGTSVILMPIGSIFYVE